MSEKEGDGIKRVMLKEGTTASDIARYTEQLGNKFIASEEINGRWFVIYSEK